MRSVAKNDSKYLISERKQGIQLHLRKLSLYMYCLVSTSPYLAAVFWDSAFMQLLYFCNHVYPQCCRCYKITRNFRCSSITLCPLGRQQQREQDWLYSSQETSSFKNFLALGGLSRAGAAKPVNFDRLNTYRILRNVTRFTWFQVLPSCTSLQIMLVSNILFF